VTVIGLDFSFNHLKILQQASFSLLPDLTALDHVQQYRCKIILIEDNVFLHVKQLTILIFTGNPIKQISDRSFSHLKILKQLTFVEVCISSIGDLPIFSLTKLKELNMGKNNLKTIRMPHTLNFTALTLLEFCNSNILSVLKYEHSKPTVTIILSKNRIADIEPIAFNGMHIGELHLRSAFTSPENTKNCLRAMAGLKVDKPVLGNYRDDKTLISSQTNLFEGLCMITFQEIHLLNMKQFPKYLETMDVFSCLAKATIKILHNRLFKNLKVLDLSTNAFNDLPTAQISNQSTLEKVIRNNEFLTTFLSGSILNKKDISSNHLSMKNCCNLKFSGSPQLKYLNLSYNAEIRFYIIPFNGLEYLEILDLSYSKLDTIGEYGCLQNLKNLKYLDISYTNTYLSVHNSMDGLTSLKILKMSGILFWGNISAYIFKNLMQLEYLNVCGIKHLTGVTGFQKRWHLIISINKLSTIDFLLNPSLISLKLIDLDKNVNSSPQNILARLPKNLSAFDISHNPIECTCSVNWAVKHKAKLKNPNYVLCKSPLSSLNKKVIKFNIDSCKNTVTIVITTTFSTIIVLTIVAYKYQYYFDY
uniref:LRRCT domain-containing protein n=1 Tax=Lepisosteus oculatus TaxID=7918 RepID=W5M7V9_LEPOC